MGVVRGRVIGISADLYRRNELEACGVYTSYVRAVARAGGVPLVVPPVPGAMRAALERVDGVVLTGGDDPSMEAFGGVTDVRATRVFAERQAAETEMLELLAGEYARVPVLGVCLGMQMMALVAGGELNQRMEDDVPTHGAHWNAEHGVVGEGGFPSGRVWSKHRQAVRRAGRLRVVARGEDGVIEAVEDPGRRFCVGVQWHPERTGWGALGQGLFDRLVGACG
jgi:putative glutamine amidotransferase